MSHREAGRAPRGRGPDPYHGLHRIPGEATGSTGFPQRTAIAGTRSSKHPMKEPIVGIGSDGSPNRDLHRTSGGPGGEGPCRTPRPPPITRSSRSDAREPRAPGGIRTHNPRLMRALL